jgi:hypothetical protein
MRQFAGFGTVEETNARFRYLLDHGQTGLSTAFDMPSLMGLDSDHDRSLGEVGVEGVAVDTVDDMETLFDGIPLDEVTVSIALLNEMPIEMVARLMEGPRSDLLLIPCRSARLNWPTVESILRNRPVMPAVNERTMEIAERDYRKLSLETAQRTVRFWQLHNKIEK